MTLNCFFFGNRLQSTGKYYTQKDPAGKKEWVVPENIRTPTTGGILEFRMHGGVLWPGIPYARGVAGIGIPNA